MTGEHAVLPITAAATIAARGSNRHPTVEPVVHMKASPEQRIAELSNDVPLRLDEFRRNCPFRPRGVRFPLTREEDGLNAAWGS
jgi:hypothetical protein